MHLKNDVIPLWIIIYDFKYENMYIMPDRDAVRRSVLGALEHYVDSSVLAHIDGLVRIGLVDKFLTVNYTDNTKKLHHLDIIRVELDSATHIHKILTKILEQSEAIDPSLFIDAIGLYADPSLLIVPQRV